MMQSDIRKSTAIAAQLAARREEDEDRLLAVDDSSFVVDLIKFALRDFPIQVISAVRPELALALLEKEKFSIVVTDINMPSMNGLDFVKKLRCIPLHLKTPVLVLSGYEEQEYVDAAYWAGATAYMRKPFTSAKLLERVLLELQREP